MTYYYHHTHPHHHHNDVECFDDDDYIVRDHRFQSPSPSTSPSRKLSSSSPPSLSHNLKVAITLSIINLLVLILPQQAIHQVDGAKLKLPISGISETRLIMQDRAILHINLMNTIGICRDPRPLIIYPPSTPNKMYFPRGTLLHRCSDQTGCCPNNGEVCRPETIATIEKVFFVNHLLVGQPRATPRLRAPRQNFTTVTELITFVNHTSCKCIKLAPNSIEHDETQSVVSRPLPVSTVSFASNSFMYHMLGTVTLLVLAMLLFFLYKCWFMNQQQHHNRGL